MNEIAADRRSANRRRWFSARSITCTPEPLGLDVLEQELGQHGGVCVRIVAAADDDDRV